MKNIVFSANTSWYLYNFRPSSIKAFIAKGYHVHCVSPKDEYSHKLVTELGCEWHDITMDNKGSNPFKDLITCYHLFEIYKKLKPICVFNFTIKNNIYGTWAAKLANSIVVNNISGLGTAFINDNITTKIVKLLYKTSQPFADKVFFQNPDDFELLSKNKLVEARKLELLPGSGVNITKFHPHLSNDENNVFTFLFVGRMLADKGLYELIEASQLLHQRGLNFKIKLCGLVDNKNVSAIPIETINQWDKSPFIEWLGSSDDMVSIYTQADCVVLPSYREGMPRSLLEAGAMGLPSVATNVAGCKHIIEDSYNGFLCASKDSKSLADVMQKMLFLSEDEYKSLCINARKKVETKFDESIVVARTLSVLDISLYSDSLDSSYL
ncbi:glycosyltransferase family 4 protein [Photobacterium phosphoreum]|uniref:glycosyltransferase family 4 protein n=1 Tax=Photobacterium phosphoreum TaxID=659 RepID=UPI000D1711B6|nr:glycosyltransferase family 4 protein [Photobacterium phosphoreum]PSU55489.1 glycosyltransferase family 1 protein [Photobacterium phosphoreum]